MITVDPTLLLRELGIKAQRVGKELRARCPNPNHRHEPDPRALGSWSIRIAGERRGMHKCQAQHCGFGGGPVGLVATVLKLERAVAYRWLAERFGLDINVTAVAAPFDGKVKPEPVLRYPEKTVALWKDPPPEVRPAIAYLEGRGLSLADIERYRIGAVPPHAPAYAGRAIVPVVVERRMVDFVARLYVEARAHQPKALSGRTDLGARKDLALWGIDDVETDWVVVVEGVWGAVAIRNAFGDDVAVAACGSAWSPERTAMLEPFERVVVVHDGDPAGRAFGQKLKGVLGKRAALIDPGDGRQPDDLPNVRELVLTALQEIDTVREGHRGGLRT